MNLIFFMNIKIITMKRYLFWLHSKILIVVNATNRDIIVIGI